MKFWFLILFLPSCAVIDPAGDFLFGSAPGETGAAQVATEGISWLIPGGGGLAALLTALGVFWRKYRNKKRRK